MSRGKGRDEFSDTEGHITNTGCAALQSVHEQWRLSEWRRNKLTE